MKVCEIFKSIQGEGRYSGIPAIFVRLSGCTRQCSFCDTKYHWKGKELKTDILIKKIQDFGLKTVIWTGGEPLLQLNDIRRVCQKLPNYEHHLETNGDLLTQTITDFDYICVSPKDLRTASKINKIFSNSSKVDIKVVTDLKINKELIPYATMLMPLTTGNRKKDKKIEQNIWKYCVENNIRYCLRQHIKVWGTKKRRI